MSDRITTVGGQQYKIVDESYEDDYGSHKSNHVVYKKVNNQWQRESPECYALSRMDAEGFIPRIVKTCKECGHHSYEPIKYDNI